MMINKVKIEECIINNTTLLEREEYNIKKLLNFLQHKQSNVNKICIVGTPYGLLLYLLYIVNFSDTLFIFYGNYPLTDAINSLRKKGNICLLLSNDTISNRHKELYQLVLDYLSQNINNYSVDIYGQDTSPIVQKFINNRFVLFEDGRISYISREDSYKTRGFHINTYDDGINSIIFTGLETIPLELQNKSQLINFIDCWNKLKPIQQENILDIFGFNTSKMKKLIMSGRNIIIFTRNYSKVGKCSESNHILMYKEILSHYNLNNIIIKPHPNDNVAYEEIFKSCVILPQKMPAELIHLCGLPIKTVVSVDDSSNIFGLFNENVEIDLYPELLEKYKVIQTRNK